MIVKLSGREMIASATSKAIALLVLCYRLPWCRFLKSKAEDGLFFLALKTLGIVVKFLNRRDNKEEGATFMSSDGRYAISWSWKGLIYLISMGYLSPPVVISFVLDPGRSISIFGARFSKDMQQIIVSHWDGVRTILSAVPGEGFHRRQLPIVQDWLSDAPQSPPRNIVEFITQTSSAYWKRIDDPKVRSGWKLPTPFILPPPTDIDCNWERWITQGERFLDIPRDTCDLDG